LPERLANLSALLVFRLYKIGSRIISWVEIMHFECIISTKISNNRISDPHQNLLLAKAYPEPDLRYFSNSTAFGSSEKVRQVASFHGLYLEAWR